MDSARALVFLLVVTVLGSGCRSDKPEAIDWDLSRSHTMADVRWPRPDLELTEISPVESVRIRLPGGKVFSAGEEIHDVTLEREGETVTYVQIDSDPRSTEDVYRLAVDWAEKWDLPREPLERWHRERLAGRASGTENVRSTVMTTQPGSRPVGDVPVATLEIRYSFNDELPSLVSLQFYWGR